MKKLIAIIFIAIFAFADGKISQNDMDEFDTEFAKKEVFDPLSGYNRVMTSVNDAFYDYILNPVASGYDYVMPDPIQGAFSNFFHNLLYPMRLVNNLLQGKFQNSWEETQRFLINSTIGFVGLSDAATMHFNIPRHNEDFGQTLGHWGVGSGFHIVWPILGPSNLRDSFGLVADHFTNPISYVDDEWEAAGIKAFSVVNETSLNPDEYKNIKKNAIDLYPFLRDAYEQRREYLIKE
ncbi:MlaA family lipoprotein [Campylobacter geochelonis]|uniref:VacJ family lipoprotein n=1 Tax=Campylobacter geochelonis TaxID=1780362 RepID=A0A128EFN7_9BACT|nr:VacJ family lipoprotein [Campylobacter geochelonis]QKF71993.1 lipid asymmetry ABC transporter MlaABCDEF, lipoprotein MlaA [Campylobacter geochelonis]CZE47725.1 VacJ family lipoprotein [Campylobacter geochelonis]